MLLRVCEQYLSGNEIRLKKTWVPYSEISPQLPLAVIASEDQLFAEHYGFDVKAIEKAMDNNEKNEKKKKKHIKGGSTISQQTAKNVFLFPQRSWVRKGLEAYFTVLIELFWSKQRIMEVYLNVIETGDGIYGAEQASQTYFKKKASALTQSEAAMLAAILPNPRKWSPAKPTPYILARQQWIISNMNNIGKVDF